MRLTCDIAIAADVGLLIGILFLIDVASVRDQDGTAGRADYFAGEQIDSS